MKRRSLNLSFLLLLLGSPTLLAQLVDAKASVRVVPATEDPEARAAVGAAADVQTPKGPLARVDDFQAEFEVTIYERPEGGGAPVARSGFVVWFWKRGPDGARRNAYARVLEEGDQRSFLAWGSRGSPWRREGKGAAIPLDGPQHEEDRKQLAEETRRTEEMLRIFQLAHLVTETSRFRWLRRNVPLTIRGREVIVDEVERWAPEERTLVLRIGHEDRRLYGATLEGNDRVAEETFAFDFHQIVTSGEQIVLVPTRILAFHGLEQRLLANAKKSADIKFNVGLEDRLFQAR